MNNFSCSVAIDDWVVKEKEVIEFIEIIVSNLKPIKMRVTIFLLFFLLVGCTYSPEEEFNQDKTFPKVQGLDEYKLSSFLPTLESKVDINKNQIYAASLLMAWDEIKTELSPIGNINGDVLELMNQSKTYIDVLNSDEYSSSIEMKDSTIYAKAFFKKSLPFEYPLRVFEDLKFKNTVVPSFGFYGSCKFAEIAYYKNDQDFAIKFFPEDQAHEIILVKSKFKNNSSLKAYISTLEVAIQAFKKDRTDRNYWKYYFNDDDVVKIPSLAFHLEKDYDEIIGSTFTSETAPYIIESAYQRTAFLLNEKGAEVESEATLETTEALEEELPKPKRLLFDDTYLILLKRKNSKNPYFTMLVSNTEHMKKE